MSSGDPDAPREPGNGCRIARVSLRWGRASWIELALRWTGRAWLFAGLVTTAMADGSTAPDPSNGRRSFDIPSQALWAALDQYSAATGIGVLFDGGMSADRISAPVEGVLSPAAALQALLSSTGLTARYVSLTAVTLVPALPERRRGGGGDPAREQYFAAIQAAVVRVLCQRAETRPGDYRSVLRLWIDRSGVVRRSEILGSSGQPRRDAAIEASLSNLDVRERPALDLPQPVTLVLLPRSERKSVDCVMFDGDWQ
jgi:hypothetical protein